MTHAKSELRQAVQATGLTPEKYHDVLEAKRRRLVLESLAERTPPVDLETVAADVAVKEEAVESTADDELTRVTVSLYHSHLPKLEAAGLVEYDVEHNQIEAVNSQFQNRLSEGVTHQ